jgi:hypothetical protein
MSWELGVSGRGLFNGTGRQGKACLRNVVSVGRDGKSGIRGGHRAGLPAARSRLVPALRRCRLAVGVHSTRTHLNSGVLTAHSVPVLNWHSISLRRCMAEWRHSFAPLDLGARWRRVVSLTLLPLCPHVNSSRQPPCSRLPGPQTNRTPVLAATDTTLLNSTGIIYY